MPGSIVLSYLDISGQWMTAVAQADGLQAKHCPNEMLHSQNSEPCISNSWPTPKSNPTNRSP
ncbi:hypothetical protein NEUTE1DRAFT_118667 [Neurospora tetrasperma FGSC 2508]|uniref:Uncharacterized protein n=1 Tax=Neurospora tetrasperma (strain FGSC 2508 / ATCC MYA-4615 / P0657) TaxID=510951 RepID=F8N0Q1_NEUT8|nr:uncharacterized protein NEUTE1DRAFT_118667 [Neurospora tetrasperma FGSC 2508]EGO52191.1 hypothetical protein NEUTE1DRAFT_118667 [Neurospora tetrasperma FGSC 2508]